MFHEAFNARRCVIPVSGFYVWKPQTRSKQPFLVTHVNRSPLLLGALWCRYHTTLTTFTDSTALISVPANACLSSLTDRLPLIIPPSGATPLARPWHRRRGTNAHVDARPTGTVGRFSGIKACE